MSEAAFFYGTLMSGFDRRRRAGLDTKLRFVGRAWIRAALFDLGIYPAAVPAADGQVWGEVYELDDPASVLPVLDGIEGCTPENPDGSLYVRESVEATLEDGRVAPVWVYFYNAPLGNAPRIPSGDYLDQLRVR